MKKILTTILTCAALLTLSSCKTGETTTNSGAADVQTSNNANEADDMFVSGHEANGSYFGNMNLLEVKTADDGSYEYAPILDALTYNGGELELYMEFLFQGDRKNIKNIDSVMLVFVDGYAQEFSLEGSEKALMHSLVVPNGGAVGVRIKFTPTTYDKDSLTHQIVAVTLSKWEQGFGIFIRDTAVNAVGINIILNTINEPEADHVVKMETRERTSWDEGRDELPYNRDGAQTNIIFHCFAKGETNCYVFCDGELYSEGGKYIFAANNPDEETTSYYGISLDEKYIGKPVYVLYIPKNYFDGWLETTCNYLWD